MAGFISTENTIEEYESSIELQESFQSLYMYSLYLCGGDFSSFDEPERLSIAISNTEEKFKL